MKSFHYAFDLSSVLFQILRMQASLRSIRACFQSHSRRTSGSDIARDESQLRRIDGQSIELGRHCAEEASTGASTNVDVDDANSKGITESNGKSRIVEQHQFDP